MNESSATITNNTHGDGTSFKNIIRNQASVICCSVLYLSVKSCTGQWCFLPSLAIPVVSSEMSMLRCSGARTMLRRKWTLTAGEAKLPTAADLLVADLLDVIAIGSLKVNMVWDQWVLGVYGDVDRTAGDSLQNLLVKPVSNHKTTPWHQDVSVSPFSDLLEGLCKFGSNSVLAVKSTSSACIVARSKVCTKKKKKMKTKACHYKRNQHARHFQSYITHTTYGRG